MRPCPRCGQPGGLIRCPECHDPWVCETCGQRMDGPESRCNSGIHVGPGQEANGLPVRLSVSRFERVFVPTIAWQLGEEQADA